MSPKIYRKEETIFTFASLKKESKKHSGTKSKIRSKNEGTAIVVRIHHGTSIVLLRWNEIPCRKGKKKQKRKEKQRADKKVRLKRKTFKKRPVKRVKRKASGHGIPVNISRKDTGNQIKRKDSVHLQKHECNQPQLEYFNSDALPDFLTAKYHRTPTLEDVGLTSYLDSPPSTPTYLLPALKSELSFSTAHDSQSMSY